MKSLARTAHVLSLALPSMFRLGPDAGRTLDSLAAEKKLPGEEAGALATPQSGPVQPMLFDRLLKGTADFVIERLGKGYLFVVVSHGSSPLRSRDIAEAIDDPTPAFFLNLMNVTRTILSNLIEVSNLHRFGRVVYRPVENRGGWRSKSAAPVS